MRQMEEPSRDCLFLTEEILFNVKTWTNRNAAKRRRENPKQHQTPRTPVESTSELRAFFGVLIAINDLIEKPRYEKPGYENYFDRYEQLPVVVPFARFLDSV